MAGASDVNNSSETASIQVDPTVDSTIGDVNRDGAVNLGDGIYLANYILRVIGYEEIDEEAADIDGNGLVNLEDALYLINHELFVPEYDTFY